MEDRYDVEELRVVINRRLATYSREADSYRRTKSADSVRSFVRVGSLAAAIPLAAVGTAVAQCEGSTTLNMTASLSAYDYATLQVGGIYFYFTYFNSQSVYKSVFVAPGAGAAIIANGTNAMRFGYSNAITNGMVGGTPSRICANYQGSATYFGSFCTTPGFMGIVDVNSNPDRPGWIELSLSAGGGSATIVVGERGFETAGGNNSAHAGDCASLLDIPMPVELVSFDAVSHGERVVLEWETASELNNAGFELERATQTSPFQRIAFFDGQGTTTVPQTYRFSDQDVEPNAHYRYRLRQIDLDGTTSFSHEVEVFTEDPSQIALSEFYPNPTTNGRARLKINLAEPAQAAVDVYDVRGSLVDSKSRTLNAGENVFQFKTDDLSAGPHFAKVRIGERVLYRQFIVTK